MLRVTRTFIPILIIALPCAAQTPAPRPTATQPASAPASRPAIIARTDWADRPAIAERLERHTPQRLTIHHAGVLDDGRTPGDRKLRALLAYSQNEKKWGDVPYHFIIDRSGRIFEGRALHFAPDTNTGYDVRGHIGICVNGDLTRQSLLEPQYRALVALLAELTRRLNIPDDHIASHRDVSPGKTVCPGALQQFLDNGTLLRDLAAHRAGRPYTFRTPAVPGSQPATTRPAR